jgi:molybdopterin converting factor small subunit
MTTVRIPRPMQVYTHDMEVVQVCGKNVRALINELEKSYPGIKDVLVKEDKLRPGIAIMLDGQISQLGLLQPLSEESELVFIPAISGG